MRGCNRYLPVTLNNRIVTSSFFIVKVVPLGLQGACKVSTAIAQADPKLDPGAPRRRSSLNYTESRGHSANLSTVPMPHRGVEIDDQAFRIEMDIRGERVILHHDFPLSDSGLGSAILTEASHFCQYVVK